MARVEAAAERGVQQRMAVLLRRVKELHPCELEGETPRAIWEALCSPVVDALNEALDLLGEVPGAQAGSEPLEARLELADRVFMARLELRQELQAMERFDAAGARDAWQHIELFDGALRQVRKSLTAVASAFAVESNLESELRLSAGLSVSLETRREYAALRRNIRESEEPAPGELHARFRAVGTRIAMLVGMDIYRELRLGDRKQLRVLQDRILGWMRRRDESAESRTEGMRLWHDLAAFARVLTQVNRRQELVAHDAMVVNEAHRVLADGEGSTILVEMLAPRLEGLRGLDDEVDALLDAGVRDAARWRAPLARLAASYEAVTEGTAQSAG